MVRGASRSRSRSPEKSSSHRKRRSRSPSPHYSRERRRHRQHVPSHKRKRSRSPMRHAFLPFGATLLSKHDLRTYRPMFASYLDIQKQKVIEDMDEEEVKGRWKSFMGKWNRGELPEGWYDPQTLSKAVARATTPSEHDQSLGRDSPDYAGGRPKKPPAEEGEKDKSDEEDDDYGPMLPGAQNKALSKSGPNAPTFQDLTLRDEQLEEAGLSEQNALRQARKADRATQRERLEELVPRAEPGTRERQLEKKREAAASNRAFAELKGAGAGGGVEDVGESELMGEGGGVEEVKRMKAQMERKKNEREIRREEILRARAAEREERVAAMKAKEDKTMDMLKAIAKERFG